MRINTLATILATMGKKFPKALILLTFGKQGMRESNTNFRPLKPLILLRSFEFVALFVATQKRNAPVKVNHLSELISFYQKKIALKRHAP